MPSDLISKANSRTILIIEDERDIRELLTLFLEGEGYAVMTASNGLEGLRLLRSNKKPGLILLDMMMPVIGGLEFLDILKNDKDLASIPVYVVSANARAEDLNGARGLIRKPASIEAILKVVKSYCG